MAIGSAATHVTAANNAKLRGKMTLGTIIAISFFLVSDAEDGFLAPPF
jgi:hypothetical protein